MLVWINFEKCRYILCVLSQDGFQSDPFNSFDATATKPDPFDAFGDTKKSSVTPVEVSVWNCNTEVAIFCVIHGV